MVLLRKYNKSDLKQLAYLLVVPGLKLVYIVVNRIPRSATNVLTFADTYIPVIPMFVVPYILFYPFVFAGLIYLFKHNRPAYVQTAWSYSIGLVLCYVTYLLYQTTFPRPELLGQDIFTNMLRNIYQADKPVNCLPSIHVLGTTLIMFGLAAGPQQKRLLVNSVGTLIIISTMFTKQHGVLDVIAALILGAGLHYATAKYMSNQLKSQTRRAVMS